MNSQAAGFAHAPVTKGMLLACGAASLFYQATSLSLRRGRTSEAQVALLFTSPSELVFGSLLMYYLRVLERTNGSAKFGSLASVLAALSGLLQLGLRRLVALPTPPSVPMGLLYGLMVQFAVDVPVTAHSTMLNMHFTDKAPMYAIGAQLMLSGGRRTVAAGLCGLAAGLLYRLNVLRLQSFRLPGFVTRAAARLFGPALAGNQGPPSRRPAAAAGQPQRPGAGAAASASAAGGVVPRRTGPPAAMPPRPVAPVAAAAAVEALPECIAQLVAMGFERSQAAQALVQTRNDVEAAVSLLL